MWPLDVHYGILLIKCVSSSLTIVPLQRSFTSTGHLRVLGLSRRSATTPWNCEPCSRRNRAERNWTGQHLHATCQGAFPTGPMCYLRTRWNTKKGRALPRRTQLSKSKSEQSGTISK
ncbi:hypothetical protein NPIL_267671 [Nephila pilipes]|uniref:Uncharacterized protein n=1 Tax=Nephila pilipes TaxID=299642 RepID=A0A8X6T1V0_NEPPI|nr:hypothetical protein NPIL_267671 [Nephila pilipes]